MRGLLVIFWVLMNFYLNAQNIVGKVIDDNGIPITNALVSQKSDLSVWTKTDVNGDFQLPGQQGDILKIGALHFQTNIGVEVISTSGKQYVLLEDELLSSDVYHISFDHLRPGDYYSKEELKHDFPVPSGAGFYQPGDETTNRAFVDNTESVDQDGQSLRVKFPAGKLKTASSGVDARIPLAKTYKDNDFDGNELYLSYWIKFSDNFEFDKCGGKLPSLGGSDLSLRQNLWKGRIMWRNGGSIQFYMELPHGEDGFNHDSLRFWGNKEFDGGNICSNKFTSYLRAPGWHNIELHYKLDDGTPIGLFEGWIDGDKGHKKIRSDAFGFYRRNGEGLEKLTTNAILLSTFLGGSSIDYEPIEDVYAWFDEFRVSRSRINEYEKYSNGIITGREWEENKEKKVYPNPSLNGLFYLSEDQEWAVYSLCGIKIMVGTTSVIDLSKASSGTYILTTHNGYERVVIK